MLKYLGKTPDVVVDLGCGTGLSTRIWSSFQEKILSIFGNTEFEIGVCYRMRIGIK